MVEFDAKLELAPLFVDVNKAPIPPGLLGVLFNIVANHTYLTSSSSAYINEELFSVYVDKILVPGVKARRQFLDLPSDAGALLILDGCLAHSEEKL